MNTFETQHTLSNNIFLERAHIWEELKETSEEGLFYLKSLLEVYSQSEGSNVSKDELFSLKNLACEFIDCKQKASLCMEANKNCQRVSSTGSWRREKSTSQTNNTFNTVYEQVVHNNSKNEESGEFSSEELKRLLQSIETLEEGEIVSSIFPSDKKHFTCPLSQKRFVEPVKNKECLHTYSKAALLEYLKSHKNSKKQIPKRCPVVFCEKLVSLDSIEPDHEMEKLLKEWSSRHPEEGGRINQTKVVAVEDFVSS